MRASFRAVPLSIRVSDSMSRSVPLLVLTALFANACGSGGGTANATDIALRTVQTNQGTVFAATIAASIPTRDPNSPVPRPTATATVPPPVGTPSVLTFTAVTGGPPGGTATVAIQTDPGMRCLIQYVHPSGKLSTTAGLVEKTANLSGSVVWSFHIDKTTAAGDGRVDVTCGGVTIQAAIHIG